MILIVTTGFEKYMKKLNDSKHWKIITILNLSQSYINFFQLLVDLAIKFGYFCFQNVAKKQTSFFAFFAGKNQYLDYFQAIQTAISTGTSDLWNRLEHSNLARQRGGSSQLGRAPLRSCEMSFEVGGQ